MSQVVCGKKEKLTALQIFAWKCTNFHFKNDLEFYHRSVLNAIYLDRVTGFDRICIKIERNLAQYGNFLKRK